MNDVISLETISPNFHVLRGAGGANSWFSHGRLLAAQVTGTSRIVWITPTFRAISEEHLRVIRNMCYLYGLEYREADSDDELNGWAS